VSCRTYRHTLALLLALGIDPSVVASATRAAADQTEQLLVDTGWLADLDAVLSPAEATFWVAPESRIGSALQSALMVREIPRRLAVACETGDWSHVDVYLTLTMDYRCVVFTGSQWDAAAATWMTQRRAKAVTVGAPLGIPGEMNIPLVGDPLARMITEPLFAELLALSWWRRSPVHVP
jgi:glucosamine--fructose-6-phosphate aminotransferase (isomerizing)